MDLPRWMKKTCLYDDPEILERLREGDKIAQESVFRAEFPRLLKVARSTLGNQKSAENLVADVLTDFFIRYVNKLRESRSIGAYLRVMTVRRSRRTMARLRRHEEISPETAAADPRTSADWEADREIFLAWLERCLNRLSQKARKIVKLHYGHELSYSEIGGRLEISKQAVGKHTAKSLLALRKCLENHRVDWVRKGRIDE